MSNSDLISFLDNSGSITSFERRKKIYELTNDLDIDLLHDLKREVDRHYANKLQKRAREITAGLGEEEKVKTSKINLEEPKFGMGKNPLKNQQDETPLNIKSSTDNFPEITVMSLNDNIDDFLNDFEYSSLSDIHESLSEIIYDLDVLIRRSMKLPKNIEISKDYAREETIDLSASTLTSKIIFLKELGIIEFLTEVQPFRSSINAMASAISAITGGKAQTIQSMINPMLSTNKEVDTKNNPMNSKKTVNVVRTKLADIGFKPKSFDH